MHRTATLFKFLIPSLIGVLMFLFPIQIDGETTIPVAYLAGLLIDLIGPDNVILIVVLLINLSALLTILFSWIVNPGPEFLKNLFRTNTIWVILRAAGAVFALMAYYMFGPEAVNSDVTGGMILNDLLPTLFAVFLFAGILLPLLLNYGLLEFVGSIFAKIMRPLFTLPGRSTVDNLASWVGDGTVGVLLTSNQYEKGYYSKREASVIATTFSVVSITFSIVILDLIGLMNYFGLFYMTIIIAGVAAALIMPRIPPLSWIKDDYYVEGEELDETIPSGYNPFSWGYKKALDRSEKAEGLGGFLKDGVKTVADMWFAVLPIVMAIGTLGTLLAEYTPIFAWIGAPFVPLLELMGIPEAQAASEALFIGFTDMFLPAILIEGVSADMTRFIIGALSITQLIYLSEVGGVILGSKIPVGLGKLFVIFLLRTAITLPIITLIAHFIF
ncbi:YjiH family protein [Salinicoccus hispanicus]|uniref:YjiH family protein n=1 Tax=Salinicoccus hispanicus TaxID=157225 RepID=A0A6N8U0P0_9STAP|nr:YjiH family protein [Salinicoccus hispanicus]MXQ50496.1 YjiH family protein [Salinicoccus hispanicus]